MIYQHNLFLLSLIYLFLYRKQYDVNTLVLFLMFSFYIEIPSNYPYSFNTAPNYLINPYSYFLIESSSNYSRKMENDNLLPLRLTINGSTYLMSQLYNHFRKYSFHVNPFPYCISLYKYVSLFTFCQMVQIVSLKSQVNILITHLLLMFEVFRNCNGYCLQ